MAWLNGGDFLLHDGEDLLRLGIGGRQNGEEVKGTDETLDAICRRRAITDGLIGNAIKIRFRNDLTIGQRQAVGQVQLNLCRWNGGASLTKRSSAVSPIAVCSPSRNATAAGISGNSPLMRRTVEVPHSVVRPDGCFPAVLCVDLTFLGP
jgi:hypothetical protein